MDVLVACEFSGIVSKAFREKGHRAVSCDLLPSEDPDAVHYQGRVEDVLNHYWDLMIAHPPCTYLASSGARWWASREEEQAAALNFVDTLLNAPIGKICIENPIGKLSTFYRKPDQIVQPWQFGHGETKATCLWLKGLPLLQPTYVVDGREPKIHMMPQRKSRWKDRSRSYEGIAQAMADQWG